MNRSLSEVSDLGEAATDVVLSAVPRAMRQIRTVARTQAGGLTIPQFRTLGQLERHPDRNLGLLADHLGVSLPAASALIDRLVDAGLVDRSVDPSERRRVRLSLTPLGRERRRVAAAAVRAWWRERLARLAHDDVEALDRGLRLLETVASDADELPPEAGRAGRRP
jgi:DNA-binding MarR family transcriptional regulator